MNINLNPDPWKWKEGKLGIKVYLNTFYLQGEKQG